MGLGVGKTHVQCRHAMTPPTFPEGNVRDKADQLVPDSGKRKRSNRDERKSGHWLWSLLAATIGWILLKNSATDICQQHWTSNDVPNATMIHTISSFCINVAEN